MTSNILPTPDPLLIQIADFVYQDLAPSKIAIETAQLALFDSLACALFALKEPQCAALLGPYVPGTIVPNGARVPGTQFELDPIKAAFDIGACIRWLDYNDTWLAKEWGHPSDNLGCLLAWYDYSARQPMNSKSKTFHFGNLSGTFNLGNLWLDMIKAYEIQGILALENAFNEMGWDHVLLVKVASTALAAKGLGLTKDQAIDAISHAWIDGASLRIYRHAPNTGPRKSWAAADATRRGLELAWMISRGQQGIPSALTQKKWGFEATSFQGKTVTLGRPLGCYVMENLLFKASYPAEFHAQTAVEAAIRLHNTLKPSLGSWDTQKIEWIDKIEIATQAAGFRIIHKEGPLHNDADRDHCLQYMVAIALLYGDLKREHYSDEVAGDPRIDLLRKRMLVKEDSRYSKDYLDPTLRAIPNAVQIFFTKNAYEKFPEGQTERVEINFPIGHPKRRAELLDHLREKFYRAVFSTYPRERADKICLLWEKRAELSGMLCSEWMDYFIVSDK